MPEASYNQNKSDLPTSESVSNNAEQKVIANLGVEALKGEIALQTIPDQNDSLKPETEIPDNIKLGDE